MSKQTVLSEISVERERQDAKWGADRDHHPLEWLAILTEEFGEVGRGLLEAYFHGYENTGNWDNYREELVQVAAVAVAAIESYDLFRHRLKTPAVAPPKVVTRPKVSPPTDRHGVALVNLREKLADIISVPEDRITPEARIREDLGIDSLDMYEFAYYVDTMTGVEVPTDKIASFKTVGDFMSWFREQ